MRRTKSPVGWEHVKNCFSAPNELLEFNLPAGAIAAYIYLLHHADRRTRQCHPSIAVIAKNLHLRRNTVARYTRLLEARSLIVTENTEIITKRDIKKNGNLLYTIISMHEITQACYDRQFEKAELATSRRPKRSLKSWASSSSRSRWAERMSKPCRCLWAAVCVPSGVGEGPVQSGEFSPI